MLDKFKKRYKRWGTIFKFWRLAPKDQKLFKALEIDPDSLIKQGKL